MAEEEEEKAMSSSMGATTVRSTEGVEPRHRGRHFCRVLTCNGRSFGNNVKIYEGG